MNRFEVEGFNKKRLNAEIGNERFGITFSGNDIYVSGRKEFCVDIIKLKERSHILLLKTDKGDLFFVRNEMTKELLVDIIKFVLTKNVVEYEIIERKAI